ncbi:MAG TPA: hypothetical protein VGM14_27620 [Streptosporangiaceae bacterium]
MNDEIRLVPPDESDVDELWQRLTDEPDIRGIEAWADREFEGWCVEVSAQEFIRHDPLGTELRQRMQAALRSVEGVTEVDPHDNESWLVTGQPSGQQLARAAAEVVDELADQLRAGMQASAGPVARAGR